MSQYASTPPPFRPHDHPQTTTILILGILGMIATIILGVVIVFIVILFAVGIYSASD
jgi:hypothetical protein